MIAPRFITIVKASGERERFRIRKLERMIEERHLYPVTVLRAVTPALQDQLAKAGIMLCHDVLEHEPAVLARRTGAPLAAITRVRSEITDALKC